jgi:hypothetical protein
MGEGFVAGAFGARSTCFRRVMLRSVFDGRRTEDVSGSMARDVKRDFLVRSRLQRPGDFRSV